MIQYSKGNMTKLIVVGSMLLLSGCYGDIKDYCEESIKCMNGNENDEKACVEELKGERKQAKQYGCKKQWDAYYECIVEEMDCVSDYITDEGECDGKGEQLWECVSKNSEVYGENNTYSYYDPYNYDPYDYYYYNYYD